MEQPVDIFGIDSQFLSIIYTGSEEGGSVVYFVKCARSEDLTNWDGADLKDLKEWVFTVYPDKKRLMVRSPGNNEYTFVINDYLPFCQSTPRNFRFFNAQYNLFTDIREPLAFQAKLKISLDMDAVFMHMIYEKKPAYTDNSAVHARK